MTKLLMFLVTILLTSCVTVEKDGPRYSIGMCLAFDVDAVEETGQTANPNTELKIVDYYDVVINKQSYRYYMISFWYWEWEKQIETAVDKEYLEKLTYPVVCGSCCPVGSVCITSCEPLEN